MNPATNFRALKRSTKPLRRGDIFVMQLPSEYFLFGRVIIADAPQGKAPMPGSNLIYIYDRQSKTRTAVPADMHPSRLLVAPAWTNKLGWTKGYFRTIENRPIESTDLLKQHCFSRTLPRAGSLPVLVDEHRNVLSRRTEPCGVWGLVSYRWIDDRVSDAVGIPRVPDVGESEPDASAEVPPTRGDNAQAVLVHLGSTLSSAVSERYDLATIEDRLITLIERERLGEFDGNQIGGNHATLYMYGPDAERLFAGIEATLRAYPLCQGATVIVRRGGPGAPRREVKL